MRGTPVIIGLAVMTSAGCIHPRIMYVPPTTPDPSPSDVIRLTCDNIVAQLERTLPTNAIYRLVIHPFKDANGTASTVGNAIVQHLKGALSERTCFRVVDDTRLSAILSEAAIHDYLKEVTTTNTLLTLEHQLVGADAILVGSLFDCTTEWDISCRIIPMHQGTISGYASSRVPKYVFDGDSQYGGRLRQPNPSYTGILYHGDQGLDISVVWAYGSVKDNALCIHYSLFNGSTTDIQVNLNDPAKRSFMVDPSGTMHPLIGSDGLYPEAMAVPAKGRADVILMFRSPTNHIAHVKVYVEWNLNGKTVGRDIPLHIPGNAL